MKFYLLSDLHLEFSSISLRGDKDGILLLAGDICLPAVYRDKRTDQTANKLRPRFEQFFHEECAKYNRCYYILGNHEYYHSSWEEAPELAVRAIEGTNVRLLNKDWVQLRDDLWLFGGTLWTDFNQGNQRAMDCFRCNMNDARYVDPKQILPNFEETVAEIAKGPKGPKVIMTHHAPSMRSSDAKYGKEKDLLNYCFVSDLDGFIEHLEPNYWVHGHCHNTSDYEIGKTRILCNPRGYNTRGADGNFYDENYIFNRELFFEI